MMPMRYNIAFILQFDKKKLGAGNELNSMQKN